MVPYDRGEIQQEKKPGADPEQMLISNYRCQRRVMGIIGEWPPDMKFLFELLAGATQQIPFRLFNRGITRTRPIYGFGFARDGTPGCTAVLGSRREPREINYSPGR